MSNVSKALYETEATSQGGRAGRVRTAGGEIDVALALPKSLGGTGAPGATNPEQLFAAGYAACFENAILHVARGEKIAVGETHVTARVSLHVRPEGGFALGVALAARLPGLDRAVAEKLVRQAHQICPYSNALRGNVDVALEVTG